MILCISVLSVVIAPFSFLMLLIWFFSLCSLMSLANGFSISFILSKNQLLALFIFIMVSFISFELIYALSFKFSFLLLTLGFLISSFSSFFRCRVRLFIWHFSCFLRYACIAMNLAFSTAFTLSYRVCVVLFSFSLYFSSQLCCLLRCQGSPQTRHWDCFMVFGNFSLF